MKNCKVKYDRLEVLKYHVLKSIAANPEEFLRQVLPRGKITGGGVFIDEELKFRVRYKHNNNSNGNIGMWDRNTEKYDVFTHFGQRNDFISLYAKVNGALQDFEMEYEQAIEELAKAYDIPHTVLDNIVPNWKIVNIHDLNIKNSTANIKGYFNPVQLKEQELTRTLPKIIGEVSRRPNELHKSARQMFDRDGKLMGLLFVGVDGISYLKTLWNKKPNSKKYEWHYSNFEKKPYPFDKTHLAFKTQKKIVYVVGDPVLAEQFEQWQGLGITALRSAFVLTWFGGCKTVADLDWEALSNHDIRIVIRETQDDFLIAQNILERVVGRYGIKSVSVYRYGIEDVYTNSVLYFFDKSRVLNLTDCAFLFQLRKNDIYTKLGLEELSDETEETFLDHNDSFVCVEGILKSQKATMLYAADGAGKSLIALSIGYALATGKNVFNTNWKVPARRRVLYIDGENPVHDIDRREKAFRRCYGLDEPSPFLKMISSTKENTKFDLKKHEFKERLRKELFTPSKQRKFEVLILDNWSALYSGDEAKAWEETKDFLKEIINSGIALLFIHHASDINKTMPDGLKKKDRFFDTRIYILKKNFNDPKIKLKFKWMTASIHLDKTRSGEEYDEISVALCFVKNQTGQEKAFWLVNPKNELLEIFELRAKGMTYEQIGADKGNPHRGSTAQRKFREAVPDKIHLDKWINSK